MCILNGSYMMHGSMVPEISSAKRDFFVIFDQFLNIYHPNNQKNQNFEKLKKKKKKKKNPGGIFI